jgi:hypothetical protein
MCDTSYVLAVHGLTSRALGARGDVVRPGSLKCVYGTPPRKLKGPAGALMAWNMCDVPVVFLVEVGVRRPPCVAPE